MKNYFFLIGLVLICLKTKAQVFYGMNNYTQYHQGNLPIIISVPHGGLVAPTSIPDRTCNNPTNVTDSRTIELARQIDTALFNLTACRPHLIICNLRRTKVDCNRNISEGACGNSQAETVWSEFQHFIDTAQFIAQNQYSGKALYIDLHGHGKMPYRLELGYGLSGTSYNSTDSVLNTASNIAASSIGDLVHTNVSGSSHSELLRGKNALGTMLANAGFPSIPSQQSPNTGGFPYFNGGYNTFNHTCIAQGNTVNGLQIECDSIVRASYLNRKKFADSVASILVRYIFIHQNLNLLTNCGLISDSKDNSDLEVHSIRIFPNPVSDFFQISSEDNQGNYEIVIKNNFGALVFKANSHSKFNVSHLPSGLYFVSMISNQQQVWSGKLVKQ
ncbi:MAG: T9SS type A sorting domain-containing protein [Saprospiraceae bacterium]|nr:T9SS type A sorting domain-containing protein [Saprospiraceae bacterium]MBK7812604.1 T9SS type A sorting domain-containing protein [Saprospiraceae bacterium]